MGRSRRLRTRVGIFTLGLVLLAGCQVPQSISPNTVSVDSHNEGRYKALYSEPAMWVYVPELEGEIDCAMGEVMSGPYAGQFIGDVLTSEQINSYCMYTGPVGPPPSYEPEPDPTPTPPPSPTPTPDDLKEQIKKFMEESVEPLASGLPSGSAQASARSAVVVKMLQLSRSGESPDKVASAFREVSIAAPLGVPPWMKGQVEAAGNSFLRLIYKASGATPPGGVPRSVIPTPSDSIYSSAEWESSPRLQSIFWQLVERAEEGLVELESTPQAFKNQPFNYGTRDRNPIIIPDEKGKPRGMITRDEADTLGGWWVKATLAPTTAKIWVSTDGWRQYRKPSFKASRKNEFQANFEIARKPGEFGVFEAPYSATNGHLHVAP